MAVITQLVRVSVCGSGSRRFESVFPPIKLTGYHKGNEVDCKSINVGSIPSPVLVL